MEVGWKREGRYFFCAELASLLSLKSDGRFIEGNQDSARCILNNDMGSGPQALSVSLNAVGQCLLSRALCLRRLTQRFCPRNIRQGSEGRYKLCSML